MAATALIAQQYTLPDAPARVGQGDAVHGREKGDGRHSCGTHLDHDPWDVRQDRVTTFPMRLTIVAPIRKPQKNRTARAWCPTAS
jgi:hypothetical protein